MRLPHSLAVVAIRKLNSTAYLDAVFDCYEAGSVVLPVAERTDDVPPGITIRETLEVADVTGWYRRSVTPRQGPEPAQVSLSSGTTGTPKALLLSHDALADVTHRLVSAMRLDSSVREYVGVPVTFSFGFGRIRAVAAAGGASYLPERGFRVDEIAGLLRRDEINSLSAVPTLLRVLIAERARLDGLGSKLRWLEIGSQSMTLDEKEAIREIFPNAVILQHYGLTEASRSTFLDISAGGPYLASVGKPTDGVHIKVIDDGRIAIKGPHVASGRLTADGLQEITDEDGWLITSDLGHIEDGYLYFDGRADDLINIGGVKVPAEAFERALLSSISPYGEIAVTAVSDTLLGQKVMVVSTAIADVAPKSALWTTARSVAREFRLPESGFNLVFVENIPRTETNKIQRRALAALAEPLSQPVQDTPPGHGAGVLQSFVDTFGDAASNTALSFTDLGGDSLSYVRTRLALDSVIPDLPEDWDAMPIADLLQLESRRPDGDPSSKPRKSPALLLNLDTLRGLACLMIVALHVIGADQTDGLQLPSSSPWHQIMDNLEFVRLPLFTCLAGILYGALPASRVGWPAFMARKLRQLLPPLIFATLVFWSLRRWVFAENENLVSAFVDGYLHLWYLDSLLLIFAAAAAVDLLDRLGPRLLVLSAATAAVLYFVVPPVDILHLRNTLFLYPFFVFGIMLYRYPVIFAGRASLPIAIPLTFAYPIAYNMLGTDLPGTLADAVFTWSSGSAAIVVLLRLMPRIGLLQAISIYSFTIYLWHPAASALVRTALGDAGIHTIWVLFVSGLLAGILIPIGIHRAAERVPVVGSLFKG